MQTTMVKRLYFVVEGETDARIIMTLLDCKDYEKVFVNVAHGMSAMSSIAATLRLMLEPQDRIIVVFDSDSTDEFEIQDKIATMRYLSRADVSQVKIGVFCMVPDIEMALFDNPKKAFQGIDAIVDYMRANIESIKQKQIIKDIQSFIDE